MSDIDTLLLTELLGQGLQDHGVTDDVMQTDAVSQVLGKLADTINQQVASLQGKVQQQQQQAADTNKDVQQLIDEHKFSEIDLPAVLMFLRDEN